MDSKTTIPVDDVSVFIDQKGEVETSDVTTAMMDEEESIEVVDSEHESAADNIINLTIDNRPIQMTVSANTTLEELKYLVGLRTGASKVILTDIKLTVPSDGYPLTLPGSIIDHEIETYSDQTFANLNGEDHLGRLPCEVACHIWKHLTKTELLTCGFVNKAWKSHSRFYLRDKFENYVSIRNVGKDLLAMNNAMNMLDLGFINGLRIIPETHSWMAINIRPSCNRIFEVPLKYIYIGQSIVPAQGDDYELMMLQELVGRNSQYIQKLSMQIPGPLPGPTINAMKLWFGITASLPKLVEFEVVDTIWCLDEEFTRDFLKMCPKLRTINGRVDIIPNFNIPAKCFELIRHLNVVIEGLISPAINASVLAQCEQYVHLTKIVFKCYGNHSRANREVGLGYRYLLEKHCQTLTILEVCPCHLIWVLERIVHCVFPKLEVLEVLDHEDLEEFLLPEEPKHAFIEWLGTVSNMPKLRLCTISYDDFVDKNVFTEDEDAIRQQRDVAADPEISLRLNFDDELHWFSEVMHINRRITDLELRIFSIGKEELFRTSMMFVLCDDLHFLRIHCSDAYVPSRYERQVARYSMDALLCGLYTKEVRYLENASRMYGMDLSTYQYAPVRPTISMMKSLKRLTLVDTFPSLSHRRIVSEVSGVLQFRFMPNVDITVETRLSYRRDYRDLAMYADIQYVAGLPNVFDL